MKPVRLVVTYGSALLLLTAAVFLPGYSAAQQCPHSYATESGSYAAAYGGGAATLSFVSTGTNCTGVPSGSATKCDQAFLGTFVSFIAYWANTAARTGDAAGGCFFSCPKGSCRVGNDGLPVELMSFSVE